MMDPAVISQNNQSSGPVDLETFRTLRQIEDVQEIDALVPQSNLQNAIHYRVLSQQVGNNQM